LTLVLGKSTVEVGIVVAEVVVADCTEHCQGFVLSRFAKILATLVEWVALFAVAEAGTALIAADVATTIVGSEIEED
jgi:hypothetical protein